MSARRTFGTFGALALLLLLAACATHTTPKATLAPPKVVPLAQCMADLSQQGIEARKVSDWKTSQGCGITQAVKVEHSTIPWNQYPLMTCGLELEIADFETRVVQPEAQHYFGRKVVKMWNLGAYACRGVVGGHSSSSLSQHALGNAIDIDGFDLAGGITIRVKRDWDGSDAKAQFLHAVAKDACGPFQAVLTPNTNSAHEDHLHLDMGPYKLCGA